jgi:hypothetical protein
VLVLWLLFIPIGLAIGNLLPVAETEEEDNAVDDKGVDVDMCKPETEAEFELVEEVDGVPTLFTFVTIDDDAFDWETEV